MADLPDVVSRRPEFALQVAEVRRAFDQSFAEAPGETERAHELLLAIRSGSDAYVIRLSEIAGIHAYPNVVPLPGTKPACIGIVGLRGRLHAAFRLSALLGASNGATVPRWLLIAPGRDAPTFAVESIDGCISATPEEFRPVEKAGDREGHVRALLVREGIVRRLLDVPALVESATGGGRTAHGEKP